MSYQTSVYHKTSTRSANYAAKVIDSPYAQLALAIIYPKSLTRRYNPRVTTYEVSPHTEWVAGRYAPSEWLGVIIPESVTGSYHPLIPWLGVICSVSPCEEDGYYSSDKHC